MAHYKEEGTIFYRSLWIQEAAYTTYANAGPTFCWKICKAVSFVWSLEQEKQPRLFSKSMLLMLMAY